MSSRTRRITRRPRVADEIIAGMRELQRMMDEGKTPQQMFTVKTVMRRQGRRPRRPLDEVVAHIKPISYRRRRRELGQDRPVGKEVCEQSYISPGVQPGLTTLIHTPVSHFSRESPHLSVALSPANVHNAMQQTGPRS